MKTSTPRNPKGHASTAARLTLLSLALLAVISGAFFVREGGTQNTAAPVVWMSLINASAGKGTIKRTGGCSGCAAGGASQQSIGPGDGYLAFNPPAASHVIYVGLTNGNTDASPAEIDFAISFNGAGTAEVRENGVWKASTSYSYYNPRGTNDVFRVSVESGQIVYRKNGSAFYTNPAAVPYPLRADISMLSDAASLNDPTISAAKLLSIKTAATATYLEPALPALPAAGGKFIDPTFGTEIMRVTDASDCAAFCQVVYSYWPTFNANNTRLLVRAAHGGTSTSVLFYEFNPSTFTLGQKTVYGGSPAMDFNGGYYWHPTNPNLIYAFGGISKKLYEYNVATGDQQEVNDFTSLLAADQYVVQPSMSDDLKVIGFTIKINNGTTYPPYGYIIYNRETGTVILHEVDSTTNEVHISKGGDYATVDLDAPQRVKRWTLTGTPASQVLPFCGDGMSHNTTKFGYAVGYTACNDSTLSKWDYVTLARTTLFDLDWSHSGTGHISGLADNDAWVLLSLSDARPAIVSGGHDAAATMITLAPGEGAWMPLVSLPNQVVWWNTTDYPRGPANDPNAEIVTVTDVTPGDVAEVVRGQGGTQATPKNLPGKTYAMLPVGPYHGELVLFKTDGSGALKRLLHHRSAHGNCTPLPDCAYNDSQFGNISRDGQWVAFASNWGSSERRDVFVARLPPL